MPDINTTSLETILDTLLEKPNAFYEQVCDILTPDERHFIINSLENRSCTTCTNGCCRVESYEKTGLDEYGDPQGSKCIGWYNAKLIGKSKVLEEKDIYKLTLK